MFLFPPPKFYYSPSSFLNSLPFHNINLSPPPPHTFVNPPPSQFLLFSLLNLHLPLPSQFYYLPPPPPPPHLFYILFHPQIHRPPIDPTSTLHRLQIDATSTLHRSHIDPTSTPLRPRIDPTSTPHRPHIDPTSIPHRPYIAPASTPHQPYIDPTSTPHLPHIDPRLAFFKHSLVNSEYIQPPPHFSLHNFFIPSSTILLFFLFNVFIRYSTFLLATLSLGGR